MCTNYVKGDRYMYEVEWLLYSSWARNQASLVLLLNKSLIICLLQTVSWDFQMNLSKDPSKEIVSLLINSLSNCQVS